MKTIAVHGIMRGGIHVFTGWMIKKLPNSSVLYYNNIRNAQNLTDRLIQVTDTRIGPIRDKITTDVNSAQYTIKSFESKPLNIDVDTVYEHPPQRAIILRDPYNTLASSLAYNGESSDILADDRLLELWRDYAREFLATDATVVLYDRFVVDENYRRAISEELGLPNEPDELITLGMGGGSSFGKNNNYLSRAAAYDGHPMMVKFKADPELTELWRRVQNKI